MDEKERLFRNLNIQTEGARYIKEDMYKKEDMESFADMSLDTKEKKLAFVQGIWNVMKSDAEDYYEEEYEDKTRGQVELHEYYIENESEIVKDAENRFEKQFNELKNINNEVYTSLRAKYVDVFVEQFTPAYLKDVGNKYDPKE